MKLKTISLLLACTCAVLAAGAQSATVRVSTATELINALGPDRTIVIDATQPLNVTEALNQMVAEGSIAEGETYYDPLTADRIGHHVTYASNTDGNTLQVRGCKGLTIRAAKGRVTLLATPRYANVLEFIHCEDLRLENLIMGHTQEGYCDKGVLELDGCTHVTINDCDLFGCGTEGFSMEGCNNVTVNRCTVHDCTYYTMHILGCRQVRFNDCVFRDNQEFEQLQIANVSDVTFTACVFDNLQGPLFKNVRDYVNFYSCTFRNCEMEDIMSDFEPQGYAILAYCTIDNSARPLTTADTKKPAIRPGYWTDGKHKFRVTKTDDYHYVFTALDGPEEMFGLNCISVSANEYILAPEYPFIDGGYPRYVVDVGRNGAADYVRIKDDGGALLRSFTRQER